jgi:hypothetical protein
MSGPDNKIYTQKETNSSDGKITALNVARTCTFSQIALFLILLGAFYQFQITKNTCFEPGTITCECKSDFNLYRWIFCAIIVAILIDLRASLAIGEKYWGGFPLWTNVGTAVVLLVCLALLTFVYGFNANKPGFIYKNIATHPAACGDPVIFGDPANKCEEINPTLTALNPPVEWQKLPWAREFSMIFWSIIVYVILHGPKLLSTLSLDESYSFIRAGQQIADNADEIISTARGADPRSQNSKRSILSGISGLGNLDQSAKAPVKGRSAYEKLGFYQNYSVFLRRWHPKIVLWECFIVGIFTFVLFGYYFQEANNWLYKFKFVDDPSPYNVFQDLGVKDAGKFVFFFFLAFNTVSWMMNTWFMNPEWNRYVIISSAATVVLDLILLIPVVFVYIWNGNKPATPWNFANDIQFCKAYTTTPSFVQYWTVPENQCPNTYACPDQVDASQLKYNPLIWVILAYLIAMIVTQSIMTLFAYFAQKEIARTVYNSEENDRKEQEIIQSDIVQANNETAPDLDRYPVDTVSVGPYTGMPPIQNQYQSIASVPPSLQYQY